jgi:hypothetical protein
MRRLIWKLVLIWNNMDPNEAVEQKINQNNQISMVIPFCQEKKQRIEKTHDIYLKMIEWMKIVGQLSKS